MLRTQIQLEERQIRTLRQLSAATGRSISDLIRQGVDHLLAGQAAPSLEERRKRAIAVAGKFASGGSDVSIHHDRYLAEALRR
jgi:hypothetical protein